MIARGGMVRVLIGLAMVLVVLTAPAYAQRRGAPTNQGPSNAEIDKKQREQALDAQYRSALKRTKQDSGPARIDPWANAREADVTKR